MEQEILNAFERGKAFGFAEGIRHMKAKEWQGLTAEEIASIPNDEFRLQKVEKILKERNK